ncbi:hypothetical protein EBT25_03515 [bacterium]|nr:hypothetical protein [bacterium]
MSFGYGMNVTVKWPRKWCAETRQLVPGRVYEDINCIDPENLEDLQEILRHAYCYGEEITIQLETWQPSDEDLCGEPPMTADEIHNEAWKQHQELHS